MSRVPNNSSRAGSACGLLLSHDPALLNEFKAAAAPHQALLTMQFMQGGIEEMRAAIDIHAYEFFVIDIDTQKHEALQASAKADDRSARRKARHRHHRRL